jgi:hypothetical protein
MAALTESNLEEIFSSFKDGFSSEEEFQTFMDNIIKFFNGVSEIVKVYQVQLFNPKNESLMETCQQINDFLQNNFLEVFIKEMQNDKMFNFPEFEQVLEVVKMSYHEILSQMFTEEIMQIMFTPYLDDIEESIIQFVEEEDKNADS